MASVATTLMVWAIVLLVIDLIILYWACKFILKARKIKKSMEDAAKIADIRLRKQYNKIATMDVTALHNYLSTMFARCIETISDQEVSTKDPDGNLVLYTLALQDLLLYLGEETIAAIDYYYGKDYIIRWANHSYKVLEKRGIINTLIQNKSIRSGVIQKELEG